MTQARRNAVLEIANEFDFLVIETIPTASPVRRRRGRRQ
jgi:hypothetical protein